MEKNKPGSQKRVKLKKPKEFDFNKMDGHQHFYYDLAKEKLGLKRIFIVFQDYSYYGRWTYHLKYLNGDVVMDSLNCVEAFPASWFNVIK